MRSFKHMDGKHDQKRHGWRYGPGGRIPQDDADRAIYERGAARRERYKAKIEGARGEMARADDEIGAAREEITEMHEKTKRLRKEAMDSEKAWILFTDNQFKDVDEKLNKEYKKRIASEDKIDRIENKYKLLHSSGKATYDDAAKYLSDKEKEWKKHNKATENIGKLRELRKEIETKGKSEHDRLYNEHNEKAKALNAHLMLMGRGGAAISQKLDAIDNLIAQAQPHRDIIMRHERRNAAATRRAAVRASERAVAKLDNAKKDADAYSKYLEEKAARGEVLTWTEMSTKREKLSKIQDATNAAVRSRIGARNPSSLNTYKSSKVDIEDSVETAWNNGISEFEYLVPNNPHLSKQLVSITGDNIPDRRSYASGSSITMEARAYSPKSTMVHELGHVLESADPHIHAEVMNFYNRRTAGETTRRLSEITKERGEYSGYHDHEVGRADKFLDIYMGKDYGGRASEILSMGLQMFYDNPLKLMREDPDYFDFIFAVIRLHGDI